MDNMDILMITETKLDEIFPIGQFFIMALVVLSVLIVIEMVVVFCYTLEKIYHQNFWLWKI